MRRRTRKCEIFWALRSHKIGGSLHLRSSGHQLFYLSNVTLIDLHLLPKFVSPNLSLPLSLYQSHFYLFSLFGMIAKYLFNIIYFDKKKLVLQPSRWNEFSKYSNTSTSQPCICGKTFKQFTTWHKGKSLKCELELKQLKFFNIFLHQFLKKASVSLK